MATIPEPRTEGLHPDHVGPLQAALAQARELLAAVESGEDRRPTKEAAGTVTPEGEGAGSPWDTDQVVSWVSPNIKKNKEEK